ncbi:MAG: hypothetical protein L7V87_09995, partial [Verrucomicrobiales bacterium]|nr:hypothetical protein [Verrucomicrobiales bacterium]
FVEKTAKHRRGILGDAGFDDFCGLCYFSRGNRSDLGTDGIDLPILREKRIIFGKAQDRSILCG